MKVLKHLVLSFSLLFLLIGPSFLPVPVSAQPGPLQGVWPYTFYNYTNAQTNTTITANGSSTYAVPGGVRFVSAFLTVIGTVSGTTPTLNVQLQLQDPQGQALYIAPNALISANCTATSCIQQISVGPTFSNTANVSAIGILTQNIKVVWTVGGTTPSFGGSYITLVWSN